MGGNCDSNEKPIIYLDFDLGFVKIVMCSTLFTDVFRMSGFLLNDQVYDNVGPVGRGFPSFVTLLTLISEWINSISFPFSQKLS